MRVLRTLRGRLVLALLCVTAVGLGLMGFASTALLERSLVSHVDERLVGMAQPWERGEHPPPMPPGENPGHGNLPTDFRVLFFDRDGRPVTMLGQSESDPTGPVVHNPEHGPEIRTVPDRTGGAGWRVRTSHLPDGQVIALALSMRNIDVTVQQLVNIELVVGAAMLVLLVAAAAVTVRLGLRPLTRIEHTADAIAAGQLDRRVPDRDPRTETGRLGSALNTMLERLVDALQQREHSEQRLRRFVADASHELRTPLTSIRGFAELYRRSSEPREEDVRLMMSRIEGEAQRMGSLVEDLLLLARLDRERSVELTDLDLVPLVHDAAHDARARDPQREIVVDDPGHAVRVLGDSARLRQVVANLVTNALVHTTPGSPVRLSVGHGVVDGRAAAAAGAEIPVGTQLGVVEVADSGPGIAPEHARRVFDRFYRVADGRERASGSTGLGLAITSALAEAHNGRVELRANRSGGSTFRLLLPLS